VPVVTTVHELIELIRSELRIEHQLEATTPLLSSGMVDSLSVAILLDALEDELGVAIPEDEISVDTFDTPEQILARIESSPRPL
jgi:acyl carrier protein